jgi:acyl-CoA synthetase (AMP-forming)/AMP-acid ligase II
VNTMTLTYTHVKSTSCIISINLIIISRLRLLARIFSRTIFQVVVVGVPDARLGQNICACIIPQAGAALREEDIRRCFDDLYQTDEGLGITPGYFLFLEQFPIVNGKTDRKGLVRMAIEKFGISE